MLVRQIKYTKDKGPLKKGTQTDRSTARLTEQTPSLIGKSYTIETTLNRVACAGPGIGIDDPDGVSFISAYSVIPIVSEIHGHQSRIL